MGYFKKKTKQREELLDILSKIDKPLSPDEIYNACIVEEKSISVPTIYRTLNLLSENGEIEKFICDSTGKASYYAKKHNHEHEITCVVCDKKIRIDYCPFEKIEKMIEKTTGFKLDEQSVNLKGYCPECQTKI